MAYSISQKELIIKMRKKGLSLNEIYKKTRVSKSTLSIWLRNVKISEVGKTILLQKIKKGQYVSAENKKANTNLMFQKYLEDGTNEVNGIVLEKNLMRVLCSLLYWCEGAKSEKSGLNFTNSDPNLVKTFLFLLRNGFDVDENKFSVCVHLHEYHNQEQQLDFWSRIANISREKFIKPYKKQNTGKRKRKDYQGCVTIRYYSNDLARRVLMLGKATIMKIGGIV